MPKNFLIPRLVPRQTAGLITRIPRNKTAAMMLLLEHAVRGYRFWTRGTVHNGRALQLAEKFDQLYGTGATPPQRSRRKAEGIANAHLVMYPDNDAERILWWLQVTPGRGPVHDRERLFDGLRRHERLRWTHQYLLAYRQRTRRRGGKASWSWWLQPKYLEDWSRALRAATSCHSRFAASAIDGVSQGRPEELRGLVQSLLRVPMFGGARSQIMHALDVTHRVWLYRFGVPAPFDWPQAVPWIGTRLPIYSNPAMTLAVLVTAMTRQHLSQADGLCIEENDSV